MPDFATTDLTLAIAHHILIFTLAGVLAFEIGAIRSGMTGLDVARVDAWYGILAGAISWWWDFAAPILPPRAGLIIRSICSSGPRSAPSPWWGLLSIWPHFGDHPLAAGAGAGCRARCSRCGRDRHRPAFSLGRSDPVRLHSHLRCRHGPAVMGEGRVGDQANRTPSSVQLRGRRSGQVLPVHNACSK